MVTWTPNWVGGMTNNTHCYSYCYVLPLLQSINSAFCRLGIGTITGESTNQRSGIVTGTPRSYWPKLPASIAISTIDLKFSSIDLLRAAV